MKLTIILEVELVLIKPKASIKQTREVTRKRVARWRKKQKLLTK